MLKRLKAWLRRRKVQRIVRQFVRERNGRLYRMAGRTEILHVKRTDRIKGWL